MLLNYMHLEDRCQSTYLFINFLLFFLFNSIYLSVFIAQVPIWYNDITIPSKVFLDSGHVIYNFLGDILMLYIDRKRFTFHQ